MDTFSNTLKIGSKSYGLTMEIVDLKGKGVHMDIEGDLVAWSKWNEESNFFELSLVRYMEMDKPTTEIKSRGNGLAS